MLYGDQVMFLRFPQQHPIGRSLAYPARTFVRGGNTPLTFSGCVLFCSGHSVDTAALSGKLGELATLLADRDAKMVQVQEYVKNRYGTAKHVFFCVLGCSCWYRCCRVVNIVGVLLCRCCRHRRRCRCCYC